jgi:hypothetical protein
MFQIPGSSVRDAHEDGGGSEQIHQSIFQTAFVFFLSTFGLVKIWAKVKRVSLMKIFNQIDKTHQILSCISI